MHLRKLDAGDLDDLLELDSDPEVMRYISGGVPNTRRDYVGEGEGEGETKTQGLLPRMLAWSADDPVGFYAALHEGAFVGWFHLRPSIAEGEDALELGYRLHRAAWGRGLATEGARALATLAVDALGCPLLDGCAMPGNRASIAVLEKCGLRFVDLRMHPRAPVRVAFYRAAAAAVIRDA
nr:GNAT family N-acetyltransferase [Pseudenhygromyxa sp. WMMC2535]